MDLFSKLGEGAAEKKKQILAETKEAEITQLLGDAAVLTGNIPPDPKSRNYLDAAKGWVYACIGAIADDVAKTQIRLYRQKGKEVTEVETHPALDLLYRANDFTTQFDLMWMTSQYLELTGEAPWFIQYQGSKPTQILLLRPDYLEVIPGTAGNIINGYRYKVGGKFVPLTTEEVVFLRYPDPSRQFRGAGTLQAVARTVDIEEYSEEYNRNFFFNSARPDGSLTTDQKLTKEQISRIEKKLSDKFRGIGNAHKTLILQKGLKWQALSLSAKDMDFIEQSKFSRDKILAVFRVPPTILGIAENVNRANAEATDYVFARRTIQPKLIRIEQQLNEFLLPKFPGTEGMFFQFDNPVPEDEAADLAEIQSGLRDGWLTINEAREEQGYDSIGSDGDKLRVPISTQPIDFENVVEGFSAERFDNNLKHVAARDRKKMQALKLRRELTKRVQTELVKVMRKGRKPKKGKKVLIQRTDEVKNFHVKQLNLADKYQSRFFKKFNGIFNKQRDEVLARFPKGLKAKKDIDPKDFYLNLTREKKRYALELSESFRQLLIEQSAEAFEYIGQDNQFDPTAGAITRYLESRAFRFATPVTRETNRLLGNALSEGINAGESIPDLKKRVESVFTNIKGYRSERIARSETIRASNYATQESWKESGVVSGKEWLTAEDEAVCPWCGPLDGKVVEIDGDYFKRGSTVTGSDGRPLKLDYETVQHPPLHVNCRCTLVPVVVEGRDLQAVDEKLDQIIKDNVKS